MKLKAQRLLADAVDKGQAEGRIATRQTAHRRASPTPGDAPKTLDEIGIQQQRVSEARRIRDAFTDEDIDLAAADATDFAFSYVRGLIPTAGATMSRVLEGVATCPPLPASLIRSFAFGFSISSNARPSALPCFIALQRCWPR